MQQYILDLAILAIIGFCAYRGYKNGIMSGILTLTSAVLAAWGAKVWTPFLSPYIGKVIGPFIESRVAKMPEDYLSKLIPSEQIAQFMEDAVTGGYDAFGKLINELTFSIQNLIAFLIIFVIIVVVASKLLHYVSLNLPLFRTVNRMLGWIFGAFVGVVLSAILFGTALSFIESKSEYVTIVPYFENSIFYKILWTSK